MIDIHIMALRHSAFYTPLLMTIAGGFLKQAGFKASYQVATPENTIIDNIRANTCHLAQSAVATSFEALSKGEYIDVVHFAQINNRDGFFIAGRDPQPDFQWHDIMGKTLLADHFFQPYAMLKYGLYKQGVDWDRIHIVDAGNVDDMDTSFREGVGDYVHQQGPAPQQMQHEGLAHVVACVGDAIGPVAFSSLCASREWLQTDMAKNFMYVYRQSKQFVTNSPAHDIAQLLRKGGFFQDIDERVLINTVESYQRLGCWDGGVSIPHESYSNLLDVFAYSGYINTRYPYADVVQNIEI